MYGLVSGSNLTRPGPRYTIHLIWTPRSRRGGSAFTLGSADVEGVVLRGRGFGIPSSWAVTVNVTVSGSVIVCAGLPVIDGGSLLVSRTPPPLFSEMTSSFNSHSGWSHAFAWSVRPCEVSVHTSFCCLSQSFGTVTLNTNRCRLG